MLGRGWHTDPGTRRETRGFAMMGGGGEGPWLVAGFLVPWKHLFLTPMQPSQALLNPPSILPYRPLRHSGRAQPSSTLQQFFWGWGGEPELSFSSHPHIAPGSDATTSDVHPWGVLA